MEITKDKYELPLAVADSPQELAKMLRKSVYAIYNGIYRTEHGLMKKGRYRYIKVLIDEEVENE